jgi:hypothetical protein
MGSLLRAGGALSGAAHTRPPHTLVVAPRQAMLATLFAAILGWMPPTNGGRWAELSAVALRAVGATGAIFLVGDPDGRTSSRPGPVFAAAAVGFLLQWFVPTESGQSVYPCLVATYLHRRHQMFDPAPPKRRGCCRYGPACPVARHASHAACADALLTCGPCSRC